MPQNYEITVKIQPSDRNYAANVPILVNVS